MSSIFGGSKSKQQSQQSSSSQSSNRAYDTVSQLYTPVINQGNQALSQVSALLGIGGDSGAARGAFDNYLGSTDYGFTVGEGQKAITGNAATRGLLNSGATLKALNNFGQNTAQKYLGDYITRLLGIGTAGQNAGQLLTGAGQISSSTSQGTSSGSSSSQEGAAKTVGSLASLIAASDRRLKTNIVKVGVLEDGLGVYEWTYTGGGPRIRGHMADEIEALRPWALGPTINGFQTVDYAKV